MDSVDPLDPETMQQLRELGDDAFIAELAEMFLTDFDPGFSALTNAIATGDRPTAAAKAHFLKGSSMSIGLSALAAVLADVEHHFRDGAPDFTDATMSELQARAAQARVRLTALIAVTEAFGVSSR